MTILKVFIGYDHRQSIAYNVLQHSIISQSSKPVAIIPLVLDQLNMKRTGLTPFTFTRFLVPHLCDYQGWALFLDIDMVVKDDIAKLFDLADDRYAVMVSKNQHRFEWASAMLFNCERNKILTEEYIRSAAGLHGINWVQESEVGALPPEWNFLVGYDELIGSPKLIHYTQGIPLFPETRSCDFSKDWEDALNKANSATNWHDLMGTSIHAELLPDGSRVPKFVAKRMKSDEKTAAATAA